MAIDRAEVAKNRKLKIGSLTDLLSRNDFVTIKFLQLKLTNSEWQDLINAGKCTKEQMDKCVGMGMLAYAITKARFSGTPVEEVGARFEKNLEKFLRNQEADLAQLRNEGYHFSPQWRNDKNVGSRSKKATSETESPSNT